MQVKSMEATDNNWLISAGLVTSSIIAITANSFLLLIFCRRRGLRTVPNRFVINLLATNLLSSLLLIPLLVADQEFRPLPPSTATKQQNLTTTAATTTLEIKELLIHEEIITTTIERQNGSQITTTTNNNTSDVEILETSEMLPTSQQQQEQQIFSDISVTNHNNRTLLCYIAQSGTTFVCTLSILSILLIGINQYFGVIHSLRYHFYINKCRSTILIFSTWLVALLFSLLSSLAQSDVNLWIFCVRKRDDAFIIINNNNNSNGRELLEIFNTIYAFSYFILVILAPFVAICIIYVCIYRAAHKNSERMRKSHSANLETTYFQVYDVNDLEDVDDMAIGASAANTTARQLPKVHSAPDFIQHEQEYQPRHSSNNNSNNKVVRTNSDRNSSSSPNFITNLKHKISNASVFKYREETRAAKISILVIFLVLICYIPYGIIMILNSDLIHIETPKYFNCLSLILLVFSNILSPFLFGYRNKRVKREIRKVFGLTGPKMALGGGGSGVRRTSNPTANNNTTSSGRGSHFLAVPEVVVTCKTEINGGNNASGATTNGEQRKSILKRVCQTSNWANCKKCNFITVPQSCVSGEARGSFSSASTQISNED